MNFGNFWPWKKSGRVPQNTVHERYEVAPMQQASATSAMIVVGSSLRLEF